MITWWLMRAEFVALIFLNEFRYTPDVSCAWTLDKLMNQKTTRHGRLMTSVPVTHISSYSTYITWTFSCEFNLSTHHLSFWSGSDEMTAWNAWNPSKFDTIWNEVGPHVARLRTMQLYNKLWSRSCDPRYKALWPRFHAQLALDPWSHPAISSPFIPSCSWASCPLTAAMKER